MMEKKGIALLLCLCILLLGSCALTKNRIAVAPPFTIISGKVTYPNNLYFPSRVRLEITLWEMDPHTRQLQMVVQQTIANPQRFPLNFTLRYEARQISLSKDYYINAVLYRQMEEEPYLKSPLVGLFLGGGQPAPVLDLSL
ncbi:MAG: YbaY family lipoprotein [Sphaerochaetaceae bacterium]|jgi:uncharacterized lipoprotein YbaY